LIAHVSGSAHRQVGIVSADGYVANYTGEACLGWAGSVLRENYTAQGNILAGKDVVTAMAKTFENAEGELAERLMAALIAGQERAGNARGQQSVALLLVREGDGYSGFNARYMDLRVDDHERPIEELQRLLQIQFAMR